MLNMISMFVFVISSHVLNPDVELPFAQINSAFDIIGNSISGIPYHNGIKLIQALIVNQG